MKFKDWLTTEVNHGLERHFRNSFPHLPDYVARQTLYNRVMPLFKRSQLTKVSTTPHLSADLGTNNVSPPTDAVQQNIPIWKRAFQKWFSPKSDVSPPTDSKKSAEFMGDEEPKNFETLPSLYGHRKISDITKATNWQKKVIEIHPTEFSPRTIRSFYMHQFGIAPLLSTKVRDHEDRLKVQQQLADERGDSNEPIILVQSHDGYDMQEGWHRLYSYMLKVAPPEEQEKVANGQSDQVNLNKWGRIKIQAYIGQIPQT